MKVLFIGEAWLGSCARSLREAMSRNPDVELDEMAEEAYFPRARALWLRVLNRLTFPLYRREFNKQALDKIRIGHPDIVMTYKGNAIHADLVSEIRRFGALTVNVYPDYSPHAYGKPHRRAVGAYDLVISTKLYHPKLWSELYGYRNRCLFVPQGYDPSLHLSADLPTEFEFDVVIVATYRQEYGRLMIDFAKFLNDARVRVAVGGHGWDSIRQQLPSHWFFPGAIQGRSYISLLRSGKICIAPLTRNVVVNGQRQPGDVDTTRSYELAAAHCFFVHQRTDYVLQLYGAEDVPMFDDASELAGHVQYFLEHDDERARIAAAAHRRAVPAYSINSRAAEIVKILWGELHGARWS